MSDHAGYARRCSGCDVDWPDGDNYAACPLCHAETWRSPRTKPLTVPEANAKVLTIQESRRRYEDFERYYVDREAQRVLANFDFDTEAARLLEA